MNIIYRPLVLVLAWAGAAVAFGATPATVSGYTKPFKDETLSMSMPGTLARVNVREGDQVKKGDVLLALDKLQEELEVARRKLVWESRAEVESAAARVTTIKVDLDGTRKLYESTKSVSKDDLQKKELELKLAEAEFERLQTAEAREKIEYDMALEQLRKRTLTAPADGTVTKVHLQEGETCEQRQPLIRLVDTTKAYFVANLEARLARGLKKGDAVKLEIETGAEPYACEGQIDFVSPVVDAASGLQEIKVLFVNPNGSTVRPGVGGTMQLPGR